MDTNDTSMHVLQAVASIGALGRENDQLLKGTARQAATIRTLNERNSNLEAEVVTATYHVEFLKNQGRKTRNINRERTSYFKTLITSLNKTISGLTAQVESYRKILTATEAERFRQADQAHRLSIELKVLQNKYDRLRSEKPIESALIVNRDPGHRIEFDPTFQKTSIQVNTLSMTMVLDDMMRDEKGYVQAVARQIMDCFTQTMETEVLNLIENVKLTRAERHKRTYEERCMQMRQQRQTYSDF